MKVHEAIAKGLADHGVDRIFGIIGDANLFIVDAFVKAEGGAYVAGANESGAVLMANGYATTLGRLSVATVTHGPALSNTVTALLESVRNRTPLLLLAGDTSVGDDENLQNIEQRDVVLSTGAGFVNVTSASTVVGDLAKAVRMALVERRPVCLNVAIDLQWQDVEYQPVPLALAESTAIAADSSALDEAVGIIATARRPVVLAGRGAVSPASRAAVLRLAERIGAPVATTLKAKELFRDEPYNLGIFGTLSTPVGAEAIVESDCVIAFGAGLNKWTTAEGSFLDGKRVIHCDIDRAGLGRFARPDVAIVGDAATVADTIVEWLDQAEAEPTGFRSEDLAQRLKDYSPGYGYKDVSTDTTVDWRTVLVAIEEAVPRERIVVTDGGRFIFETWKIIQASDPKSFLHTVNIGSIGLGMGCAIGASFSAPDRPTLLVTGDGGFMLGGLAEFNTAVRHGVDLIVVVANDGAYGAEHIQFRARDMDPSISMFEWPDLAPVAEALGGAGYTIRNLADLDGLAAAINGRTRPLLIDVKLDPDNMPEMGTH